MNTTLLRLLVTAAGRSAEQGTLVEIVETAARLMALLRPLLTDVDGSTIREPATSTQPPLAG
jgi:hypothetical protein